MSKICGIPECGRPVLARGMCNSHYSQFRRTGDPIPRQPQLRGVTLLERIVASVSFDDDGCWRWTRGLRKGYGSTSVDGKSRFTHRLLYEIVVGPVPDGLELDHLCRNRACCNPDHLEPVTTRVNVLRGEGAAALNLRKTHCVHGHERSPGNTYFFKSGRRCRVCRKSQRSAA